MTTLTSEQVAAVTTEATTAYVQAGPGTGKTLVLAERVRHLIEDRKVDPLRILALTFTRKAAVEVRQRVASALTPMRDDASQHPAAPVPIVCGTFHAVALGILEQDGDVLGYHDGLTVLDTVEAEEVFKQIATDLGYRVAKSGRWKAKFKLADVVAARNRLYQTGGFAHETDPDIERLVRCYHERLFSLNSLDFGLILTETRKLLMDNPAHDRWAARFDHVLVDEAQDCDELQYSLHLQFAPPAHLFLVGDVRQCIYEWRGADPEVGAALHHDATFYGLTATFRCSPEIVTCVNALMDKQPPITSMHDNSAGPVRVVTGRTRDICSAVSRLHHTGEKYEWPDIAVLCRTHAECKRIATVLGEAHVPTHRVGSGFDLCGTEYFRDVYAAMRLAVNMRDDLAFGRIAPYLGLTQEGLASLRRQAVDGHCTRFEAAGRHHTNNDVLTAIARAEGDSALDLFHGQLIPAMVRVLGGDAPQSEWSPDFQVDFGRVWHWWYAWMKHRTIASALAWFPLRDAHEDATVTDEVTVCTIHAAKGLEWPAVVVPNLTEGSLPTSRSIRAAKVDEERRVLYVAMTRAFESLTLHYRRQRDQSAGSVAREPSRFLGEAGLLVAEEVAP